MFTMLTIMACIVSMLTDADLLITVDTKYSYKADGNVTYL